MKKSYRDLVVWQKSIDLSALIYAITDQFDKAEKYGLTSQIRRCSVSVASNIAEGSARGTDKEFVQFLHIARGSLAELYTQMTVAYRINYISKEQMKDAEHRIDEIGKMLHGLKSSLTKD